jgi:hypothetical protein
LFIFKTHGSKRSFQKYYFKKQTDSNMHAYVQWARQPNDPSDWRQEKHLGQPNKSKNGKEHDQYSHRTTPGAAITVRSQPNVRRRHRRNLPEPRPVRYKLPPSASPSSQSSPQTPKNPSAAASTTQKRQQWRARATVRPSGSISAPPTPA